MNTSSISTPGVYINETNAFPNSVAAVPTAVPAFIGYTPQASYEGKSYLNIPVKITSFADFQAFFCLPDPPPPANPAKQYSPQYYLIQQKTKPASGDYLAFNGNYYFILPDANTIYYLYNSIRLFYQNGGANAYIVSVGTYGAPSGKPMNAPGQIINPNVKLSDLQNGLALLQNEPEPTMYICPEATLLSPADNSTLMQAMLSQSSTMQTSISIFDIIGGNTPNPVSYINDINTFRASTGSTGLDYGAAYYPFIGTDIIQNSDIDYTNLFGGDITQLVPIINPPSNLDPAVTAIIANIQNPASGLSIAQNNNALLAASESYTTVMETVLGIANILPPSGAMAGIITNTDNEVGPWQAPANVAVVDAINLPIKLTDAQTMPLNVDPVTGKSINTIRNFNELGILVWGARTLDGNDQDWRYIPVRRAIIFIEQSCKLALQAFVFQPNDASTWSAVIYSISSFLTNLWKQGALMGASANESFTVACGVGTTMTQEDILNGILKVSISVALVHPAEFIVINIQQQMATN